MMVGSHRAQAMESTHEETSVTLDRLQAQIDDLQKQIQTLHARQASSGSASADASRLVSSGQSDQGLTFHGITLYGVLDMGVSYQSRGASYNASAGTAVQELLGKSGKSEMWNVTPSGMSTSRIGLKGREELIDGVFGVFTVEAGFNPVSGTLADGPKSLVENNNISLTQQSSSGDSSRAGQIFNGQAFAGLSAPRYGTLTFGRHTTTLHNAVNAYDPQDGSNAFSLIGYSGAIAGGGTTEDGRLDDSIKYNFAYGPFRLGALYQLPGNTVSGGGDDAYQIGLGFERPQFAVYGVYAHKNDAISASSLNSFTATSAASASAQAAAYAANPGAIGATVSNNTTFAIMARYRVKPVTFYAGYERISYMNPTNTVPAGTVDNGGYVMALISASSYTTAKQLHVVWVGARYAVTPKLDLRGAFYSYIQDNYSGLDNGACVAAGLSSCSGSFRVGSVVADYKVNKRLDAYAGVEYSRVDDGDYVGNGYLHNNNLSPMVGGRFRF